VGTCSWTDQTLLACGRFYPEAVRTAEQRLRFYANHFDTVEVDSSYYHLPAEKNSWLWIERTPENFLFNIKAYRSLTLHERGRRAEQLEWQMFQSAISPLAQTGRLGYVLFQFPPWFVCSEENRAYILECRQRLPEFRLGIQFRHASWMSDRQQAVATLQWLKSHDLPYVAVDEPQFPRRRTIPPAAAATAADMAIVRFNGRNLANWFAKDIPVYERFHHHYSGEELTEWVPKLLGLAKKVETVFIMFNNCFEDDAIVNAKELVSQLKAMASDD
jgi:uncharacterized protein YecE (DUF72 family)